MRSPLVPVCAILLAVGAVLPRVALAQDAGSSAAAMPAWDGLTQRQRDTLVSPLRDRWDASPENRAEMLRRAERWQQMTPDQRRDGRRGMQRWQDMSPEARGQMRALHGALRALPEADRAALRARWKAMTAEERRAWVAAHPPKARHGAAVGEPRDR